MSDEPTIPARRQQAAPEPAGVHGRAGTHDFADADEIRRMQDGVRDWVQHTARRGKDGLRTASSCQRKIMISTSLASGDDPRLVGRSRLRQARKITVRATIDHIAAASSLLSGRIAKVHPTGSRWRFFAA